MNCPVCGEAMADVRIVTSGVCPRHGVRTLNGDAIDGLDETQQFIADLVSQPREVDTSGGFIPPRGERAAREASDKKPSDAGEAEA